MINQYILRSNSDQCMARILQSSRISQLAQHLEILKVVIEKFGKKSISGGALSFQPGQHCQRWLIPMPIAHPLLLFTTPA